MKVLLSDELREHILFAPDPTGQTEDDRVTLTVLDIYQIVGEAEIGRYPDRVEMARRVKRPAKKTAGTAVGQWDLVQGVYWVTYNETLVIPEGAVLLLQNHPALMENGVLQNPRLIMDWSEVNGTLLMVGARRVRLLEGAPVSVGRMVRL